MSHKALAEKLMQSINFVNVGSSFIINMFYISELSADSLTMVDSFSIPIPQRQSKTILKAYQHFFATLALERPSFRIN